MSKILKIILKIIVVCIALFVTTIAIIGGYAYLTRSREIEIIQQNAHQGDAKAQFELGDMYKFDHGWIYRHEGIAQDYQESAKWFRLAAEQNYSPAQAALGYIYRNGEGVRQDYKEAIRWFRLAAEQGQPYGQEWLGKMYRNGEGVTENKILAHMWFNLGNSEYMRNVIASEMTREQIEQAQQMAHNCENSNYKYCE